MIEEAARGRSGLLNIGLHLRITGRPARFRAVEAILRDLWARGRDIWVATRRDIAAAAEVQLPALPA